MSGYVVIDCFPESAYRYLDDYAIVVIDVIRATTTAVTALSMGNRVFPVKTADEAFVLASKLGNPLLVGELGGNMPYGFDLTNSPSQVAARTDTDRSIVLLSSSGTQLLLNSAGSRGTYIACLRNITAISNHLAERYERVAVLGAGTRGVFRREDQLACAWVAERLLTAGWKARNRQTEEYISRWHGAGIEEIRGGRSANYLMRSGQQEDLDFVLSHIDDTEAVPILSNGELILLSKNKRWKRSNENHGYEHPCNSL